MRDHDTLSLEALSARTEVPLRTIRYYIQRGLVPRPRGEKKGAHYGPEHLDALLQIKRWIGAGMSLDRIHALLHEGTPEPEQPLANRPDLPVSSFPTTRLVYRLAPGIEVVVDPDVAELSTQQLYNLYDALFVNDEDPLV